MTQLTHWNPRHRSSTPEFFNRFFDRFLGDAYPWETEELGTARWTPSMDVRETDDSYEISAELPGMTKDDVDITLENNVLTLSGERHMEKEDEKKTYRRIERRYGTFTRSFTLPTQVEASKVDATFKDGILHLTIPKLEEAKPRRIVIH